MASLSHTMQRKAFSAAIDVALKRLNKDREKGLLQIIDLAQKFMGDNFKLTKVQKQSFRTRITSG